MEWAGPNFVNGFLRTFGVLIKTIKMRSKRSNMSYCKPNVLGFDYFHQFYPFRVSANVRNYDFVAKITATQIFRPWATTSYHLHVGRFAANRIAWFVFMTANSGNIRLQQVMENCVFWSDKPQLSIMYRDLIYLAVVYKGPESDRSG